MKDPYRLLGIVLCLAGAVFTPIAYFILDSAPLSAVGLSTIVIGIVCVALASARPYISPEASQILLKTGMENTAALLEELGLKNRAVYLPSSMRDGRPQAIVPLEEGKAESIKGKVPGRLIVRYGAAAEDMGIAVTTPGSMTFELLKAPPGPTSAEIESAASYILTGVLDLAGAVAVTLTDNRIDVLVKGARLHWEDIWYYRCLGSPIASIVASICSEALGKPVRIGEESYSRGESRIALEVLS